VIRVEAPAKINLCLRVGEPRSDGFHRVVTVFVALGLADVLEIEPAEATAVEGFDGDTLVRGALDLLGETQRVRIEKRIPVAAGLGGGSSDAAAVLRALGVGREPNELYRMARELGSDVPFFLSGLEVALGTGRGDRLTPLLELPRDFGVVLVPDPDGLSTAEVYARCTPNPLFAADEGALVRGVHTARDAEGVARLVGNDLEPAALALRPELQARLDELRRAGALAAAVSGSGPTVFGIFRDPTGAERAAAQIQGALATAPR
jgi:4-diphosphocytidyl-2-C-methyl-D-erythritol kinase